MNAESQIEKYRRQIRTMPRVVAIQARHDAERYESVGLTLTGDLFRAVVAEAEQAIAERIACIEQSLAHGAAAAAVRAGNGGAR
jgi:hypothetical protein